MNFSNDLFRLVIVYDFACNFREYTLNREPSLFQTMQVFIDRFHEKNHCCGVLYSLNSNQYLKNL